MGHLNGSEIQILRIPSVIDVAEAFRPAGDDLIKYLSATMGLLYTKINCVIQLQHLKWHTGVIPNSMNYCGYIALKWAVLNFGTVVFSHEGSINDWNAVVAFYTIKQTGVVLLCSCDSINADMHKLGYVLLWLEGKDFKIIW